ncbi:MAG: MerR family transcriptional regulator [Halopseudomonas sp.]
MNQPVNLFASIDEISRDIGVGKDTLRVWERRYGFPQPIRNDKGERSYPREQWDRLRTISRLLDRGYRPGNVVALTAAQLDALATQEQLDTTAVEAPQLDALIDSVRQGDVGQLQQCLSTKLQQQGAQQFVLNTAAPLLEQTGNAWASGQLPIYMEHLITHHLGRTLQQAAIECQPSEQGLQVLLTTLPGERHGMGLMMVDLLLTAQGTRTFNLGVETPVDELIRACEAIQPQVLALSFSSVQKRAALIGQLRELSLKIPASVVILIGGEGVAKLRMIPQRIRVVKKLDQLESTLNAIGKQIKNSS